jgi:hypothetical protein
MRMKMAVEQETDVEILPTRYLLSREGRRYPCCAAAEESAFDWRGC